MALFRKCAIKMLSAQMLQFTSGILAGILIAYALTRKYGSQVAKEIFAKLLIPLAIIIVCAMFIAQMILFNLGIELPF